MRALRLPASVLGLCLYLSAHANGCEFGGSSVGSLSQPAFLEIVKSRLAASDYSCAVHATQVRASSNFLLPGRAGFDARFALREMALAIVKDEPLPSSTRVELLRAAAATLRDSGPSVPKEELRADARFLLIGARQLLAAKDLAGWVDTVEAAVRVDRRMPDSERSIDPSEIEGPLMNASLTQDWKRLAKLSDATWGDKYLMGFRGRLAGSIDYSVTAVRGGLSEEQFTQRARDLLALVESLKDTASGYTCRTGVVGDRGCSMEWLWKPYMRAGLIFHQVGMSAEAKKYVDQALQIVRGINEPAHRSQQIQWALWELQREKYDRPTILAVVADLERSLAESPDTQFTREIRANLTRSYKELGINRQQ